MPFNETEKTRTEVVGVFDGAEPLQEAIDELLENGFDRAEVSLLAGERTVEKKLGHTYKRVEELEDDPSVPRTAYVSTEARGDAEGGLIGGLVYIGAVAAAGAVVATGGTLAAAIGTAVLAGGAGGVIGGALASMVGDHHAQYLQEQLDHGGMLLWVRTWNADDERRASDILSKHAAHDVHVHSLMGIKTAAIDLEQALIDPGSVFETPEDVAACAVIDREQKVEILRRWGYDSLELEVAEEENMTGGEQDILDRVVRVLALLGVEPDIRHRPPTKQGAI
jgi:hypothetical protein